VATSGTVYGNNVTVSGSHVARTRVDWQLAGQNTAGNYSTINWQGYVEFFGCDAQLDGGYVHTDVGDVYSNGGRVYNYAGNFSNHTIGMGSGQFTEGHDAGGNHVLTIGAQVSVYQSGTSSGSGSFQLPTIPRYANINRFDLVNITDTGFDLVLGADNTCDIFTYWINGGAHNDVAYTGSQYTFNIRNLPISDQDYTVNGAVRRQDSGLWTNSSTYNVHTLPQNGFLGLL
jgi:hypothetical protein